MKGSEDGRSKVVKGQGIDNDNVAVCNPHPAHISKCPRLRGGVYSNRGSVNPTCYPHFFLFTPHLWGVFSSTASTNGGSMKCTHCLHFCSFIPPPTDGGIPSLQAAASTNRGGIKPTHHPISFYLTPPNKKGVFFSV